MKAVISYEMPIRTPSAANQRLHHMEKARQNKQQRADAMILSRTHLGTVMAEFPILIRLTRISPGMVAMDDDNLPRALKAVRDGICDALGIDDGDVAKIRFEYEQKFKLKRWAVVVTIFESA